MSHNRPEQYGLNKNDDYRLPTTILPTKYKLSIGPNFDQLNFNGSVVIYTDVVGETRNIILHSKNLTIFAPPKVLEIYAGIPRPLNVTSVDFDEQRDFLKISLEKNLSIGQQLSIEIKFSGQFPTEGFYLYSYFDANDVKK